MAAPQPSWVDDQWICMVDELLFPHPNILAVVFMGIKKKTHWLDQYLSMRYSSIYAEAKKTRSSSCETTANTTRKIWVFWGQGEENMPSLVKACFQQLQKNNPEVNLVTLDNYSQYLVDLPTKIIDRVRKKELTWAFFSDVLRTSLLAVHGGLWLDATVWVPGKLPWKNWSDSLSFLPMEK